MSRILIPYKLSESYRSIVQKIVTRLFSTTPLSFDENRANRGIWTILLGAA